MKSFKLHSNLLTSFIFCVSSKEDIYTVKTVHNLLFWFLGIQAIGTPTYQWATEFDQVSGCDHTLLIKYQGGSTVFKACMSDFEADKPDYCNYLGYVLDKDFYIPVAATGVCSNEAVTANKPIYVSK